jgi:inosose dehydratase
MKRPELAYAVWSWGLSEKSQLETALGDVREAGFSYFESVLKTVHIYENDAGEFMKLVNREKVYPVSFYFNLKGEEALDLEAISGTMDFLKKAGVTRASIQAPNGPSTQEGLAALVKNLDRIVDLMAPSGVIPCLHPHTHTWVMYENEIDYVMERSKIDFGPDTAHLMAGGSDPVEVFKRYADRIKFVHLKDVMKNRDVQVDESEHEAFKIYSDFLELGEGDVDIKGVFDVLDAAGYDGYITVELDKAPSSQRESAFKNMEYLKQNFFPRYK